MTIRLHRGDLPICPRYNRFGGDRYRDHGVASASRPLCVVQMSNGDGSADVVQIPKDHARSRRAANLKALLTNPKITKIFHSRGSISPPSTSLRRDAAAGLLHQDRLAAVPHLHDRHGLKDPGTRGTQRRSVEAASSRATGAHKP